MWRAQCFRKMYVFWSLLREVGRTQSVALHARAAGWFVLGVVALVGVGLLGHYHIHNPSSTNLYDLYPKTSLEFRARTMMMNNFSGDSIRNFLRNLTKHMHVAGTTQNKMVGHFIKETWEKQGLENVHFSEYSVLLSYPDYDSPNTVQLKTQTGSVVYLSDGLSKVVIPSEQGDRGAGVRWNAYSAPGEATGKPVYCNYGMAEDFDYIKQSGIDLSGKIAIIRYGRVWRGQKAANAQKLGAAAVLLYLDPADAARDGTGRSKVYPHTTWMSPDGTQRGSLLMTEGDPVTPAFPAKDYAVRAKNVSILRKEGVIPSIPVLPISYADAFHFLKDLSGKKAPTQWQGGLNFTYRLGPGYKTSGWNLHVKVNSRIAQSTIRNVVGVIPGTTAPDDYVIVGNHYDAWVYGAVDPNSGTATLLEMTRVLTDVMNETKWRPDRTIVFCTWDAEEYGLIGSTEWVEENLQILDKRAIAYINVDLMAGNQTLFVEAMPSLYRVATEAAKAVPNPVAAEYKEGRRTVYDTWFKNFPGNLSWAEDLPYMRSPGAGSDHAQFIRYAGVPVINLRYQNIDSGGSYPLYHSLYETHYLMEELMDHENFNTSIAVGRYWTELIRRLSSLSPSWGYLNSTDYAKMLSFFAEDLNYDLTAAKVPKNVIAQFLNLEGALKRFENSTADFHMYWLGNKLGADRLKFLERCFIVDGGILGKKTDRHIIYGLNPQNKYASQRFPGVLRQLEAYKMAKTDQEKLKTAIDVQEQLALVQYAVECAIKTLSDFI